MKKFLTLVCMITCIFGLTACGSEQTLTTYEQQKVDYAKDLAANTFVSLFSQYADDTAAASFAENTAEEIEYLVGNNYSLNVDGYAFLSAVSSFNSAMETTGAITGVVGASAEIDDDEIIVLVEVTGEKKDATAEIILSNDMFMKLKSAALNPTDTMGESMQKAALNTVIGMGTVFAVLILISAIISCFSLIPKIQAWASGKEAAAPKESSAPAAAPAAAQPAVQAAPVNLANDLELVAVIAAAIAAYEGTSTDGFVVRSIIRRY